MYSLYIRLLLYKFYVLWYFILMNSLTARLESALKAAQQLDDPDQDCVQANNETAVLAPLGDDCEINFTTKPGYVYPANSIVVPDVQEYRALLSHELLDPRRSLREAQREGIIQHEYEHWLASLVLGATVNAFGVYVNQASEDAIVFQPFHHAELVTTKLGRAAIFAHPKTPSPSDISELITMGYEGVEDVHERIIANNKRHWQSNEGRTLPEPLSLATPLPNRLQFEAMILQPHNTTNPY